MQHKNSMILWLSSEIREIKMPQKKLLKTHLWKRQTKNIFPEAGFLFSGCQEQTDLATSNTRIRQPWKNCSETRRSMVKTGRFYINLYMFIFIRETASLAAQIFLNETLYVKLPKKLGFFCWNLTFIISRYYRHVGVKLFWHRYRFFFQYRNKTKATNFTKYRAETSLQKTLPHKYLKSFDFINLL